MSKQQQRASANESVEQQMSALFARHNRELVGFLAHRLGNDADAREVAQEAYLRLLQIDKPGEVSFLRAYLFKVAANLAMDRLRRRGRTQKFEPPIESVDLTDNIDPLRRMSSQQAVATLRTALLELPPLWRQAFLLRRVEGKSGAEACAQIRVGERQLREYVKQASLYCRLRLDGLSAVAAKEQLG